MAWEEKLLGECKILLLTMFLHNDLEDGWVWSPEPGDGYTICGAYRLITSMISDQYLVVSYLILHKYVPLKVIVFAWWLFRNRLPTKKQFIS